MKSNLDMASESSFLLGKSPDDKEITTYSSYSPCLAMGCSPRASLWAPCSKRTVSSKEETAERNPPPSSSCWGPLGHNPEAQRVRITQDWALNCKYVQNHRGVPSRGQREGKKKIPNNLGMAYSSLQLGISISVKLRSLFTWLPRISGTQSCSRPSGS